MAGLHADATGSGDLVWACSKLRRLLKEDAGRAGEASQARIEADPTRSGRRATVRGSSSLYGSGIHEESVSDTEPIRQMNKSRPPSRKNIIMEQLALAT